MAAVRGSLPPLEWQRELNHEFNPKGFNRKPVNGRFPPIARLAQIT
jgi:hypothetical protein